MVHKSQVILCVVPRKRCKRSPKARNRNLTPTHASSCLSRLSCVLLPSTANGLIPWAWAPFSFFFLKS